MVYRGSASTTQSSICTARIKSWSPQCATTCLYPYLLLRSAAVESLLAHMPVQILPEYHKLVEVFNATKAGSLPQRRPRDCAIDLLPKDFVMDLPTLKGYTCALVVVDRFSKGCRFIPFPSLPSPQLILQVWKEFFKKLGITISLTSGYHRESNDQAERTVQELGIFLRAHCQHQQHDWAEYFIWAEYETHCATQRRV